MPSYKPEERAAAPPRQTRKMRIFLLALIGIATLIFFLPTIVVNTPLRQRAIDMVTADLDGSVEVENISAGWFSPINVYGLVLKDSRDNPVLNIEQIVTSHSLIDFVSREDYGSVRIVRPAVNLVTRTGSSNLEDICAHYLSEAAGDSTPTQAAGPITLPRLQIELEDGLVQLSTPSIGSVHRIVAVNGLIECSSEQAPLSAQIRFQVAGDQNPAGDLAASVRIDAGQPGLAMNQIDAEIQSANLPAAVLAPILNRLSGPINCAGQLDCDFDVNANIEQGFAAAHIRSFQGKNIAMVAPDYLGNDQFSAANMFASGTLQVSPDRISASQFQAETEFARFKANGDFDFESLAQLAAGAEIPHTGFTLDGIADLAQITSMLPQTTRLRDGVRLNSGLLQIQANTRHENGTPRMVINADAANMNMIVDGQHVNWQRPLRLALVAGKKHESLMLERIQLSSDFLNADGSAALDSGQLNVEGDLQKVTQQLGQLIDLGDLSLSGQIAGRLFWQTDPNAAAQAADQGGNVPIDVQGQFRINQPDLHIPGYAPWQEDNVDFSLVSQMNVSTQGDLAVNAARLEIILGNEKAVAVLNQPIDDLWKNSKYQFQCQATGSLAKWMVQARNFAEIPQFFTDGDLSSQFVLTLNPKSCRVNQFHFQATDFVLDGFGMNVRDPELTGKVNLKYDLETGLIEFAKSSVKGNNVAANTQELAMAITDKILLDGVVGFKTSVNHASNWFGMSLPRDSVRWDGIATGKMTFSSATGYFGGQLNASIQDLVVVQRAATVAELGGTQPASNPNRFEELWSEPEVRVVSQIDLADDFNSLRLSDVHLNSKLADIRGAGTVSDLTGEMVTNLSGQWNLKWANISQTLKEMIGQAVSFSGPGWQPITLQGPLFAASAMGSAAYVPPGLQARTTIAWNEAEAMNMQLGPGQIAVAVDQSVAQLSSPSNQGLVGQALQLKPMLDLRTANPMLVVGQGKLLDQWQLTIQDSRTWIKYAAPLIADATSAEGSASVEISGANVPLFDPLQASAGGTLEIHQLVVGAGPLAQQLLPLIDQIKAILRPGSSSVQDRTTWLQLKPQKIPVVVQNGKVHHENFEIGYKDLTIKTRGSVGFDQTMNLVAEIPVRDDWIDDNRMLAALKGKTIPIAIQGTISQPRIDRQALTRLTQQLVRDTAINAAQEKVSGEVNQLQQKIGNKFQDEVGRLKGQVDGTIENQIGDKLQNELRNGLNNLFGNDKK